MGARGLWKLCNDRISDFQRLFLTIKDADIPALLAAFAADAQQIHSMVSQVEQKRRLIWECPRRRFNLWIRNIMFVQNEIWLRDGVITAIVPMPPLFPVDD